MLSFLVSVKASYLPNPETRMRWEALNFAVLFVPLSTHDYRCTNAEAATRYDLAVTTHSAQRCTSYLISDPLKH